VRCLPLFLLLAACHAKPVWYEAEVQLPRLDIPRRDGVDGPPLALDAEFSYHTCPGSQIEVVRGGAEFARCLLSHKVGEKVKARLLWHPDGQGGFTWDVHELAGCKRPPDPEDEASFRSVRDCRDLTVNGVKVGFHYETTAGDGLIKACPWFRAR
jgi:hypothetical protein